MKRKNVLRDPKGITSYGSIGREKDYVDKKGAT